MLQPASIIRCLGYFVLFTACGSPKDEAASDEIYNEPHRPQIHFSPAARWMNDPNGMVYHDGVYHLFYQYYPDSTVWGPMHWGHATSTDLVHWKHLPIALYPDSLGYIFSGSAVVDVNNTSGFGKNGKAPLVAIFTHHDPKGEKAGRNDYQTQSLAYSLDDGQTWVKYSNNPILKNPGIKDFRDPKVSWYEAGKKWIMTLAVLDHISFYASSNLKDWTKESDFGKEIGAHGGVWECPDLFNLDHNGQKVWVLIVNINPGGPNGGSATQYFTGQFDGHTFTPDDTTTKWLDYGPDEYAGVTWSNTGDRKIFLGWMSNWQYGTNVPTNPWRSAMTIPRELSLEKIAEKYFVASKPVAELDILGEKQFAENNVIVTNYDVTAKTGKLPGPVRLSFSSEKLAPFTITLSNDAGEKVLIGYDKTANAYFIDRTNSGQTDFEKGFGKRHFAPRLSTQDGTNMILYIDNSSVELFADDGLSVMTEIFFPTSVMSKLNMQATGDLKLNTLKFSRLKSIWR